MFISSFVRQLFATGTVVAVSWDDSIEISEELAETIRAADALARAEAAFEAPELDLKAAKWSLQVLAWGCNLLMDRTEVNTNLPIRLAEQEPKGESVMEHWSADLGFRFFNSLILRCQQIGPYDSLLQQLIQIGHRWPLSLVGVQADVSQAKLELLLSNNCLRSVLVDRVVERNDEQLAQQPLLAPHIAQAVGAHPNFKQWQTSNSGEVETVVLMLRVQAFATRSVSEGTSYGVDLRMQKGPSLTLRVMKNKQKFIQITSKQPKAQHQTSRR